jgi:hypothetical protein
MVVDIRASRMLYIYSYDNISREWCVFLTMRVLQKGIARIRFEVLYRYNESIVMRWRIDGAVGRDTAPQVGRCRVGMKVFK